MKTTLIGTTLFILTAAAVAFYPALNTSGSVVATTPIHTNPLIDPVRVVKPKIDVVFVLDTTGSMSGLITAAKEKIWSIATSMASAQPAPEIRIGLVAYRDRGDAYITRTVDLSSDIDTVYATLMQFAADGGGDGPESVNQALHDAVNGMSWSQDPNSYKVVFLVGDAPPHMDYQDDVKYPQTLRLAASKGIIVNTIQCGDEAETRQRWQQIAAISHGSYFSVDQAGSAVAITTPFDADLARLSAALDETRLYYGTPEEKARQLAKVEATDTLHALASPATRARRAAFNATAAGATNAIGESELVEDVASGRVDIATVAVDKLPATMQSMSVEARKELLEKSAGKRAELQARIRTLADQRDDYAAKQIAGAGGAKDSLDDKIYSAVREQAKSTGLIYPEAPKY
jgi:Mg-chelatase subunit ChlD